MNSEAPESFPAPIATGAAPPTVRGEMPARRPAWPTVIGVIAMVLSILGILGSLWGLVAPVFFRAAFNDPALSAIPSGAMNVVMQLASLAVNTLLLVGAISVLGCNRTAPRLLRLYAIVQLIVGTMGIGYGMITAPTTIANMQAQMGGAPSHFLVIMTVFGFCMGFVFMATFPVFLLIWFSREGVKRDVARWFTGGAAATT